MSTIPEISAAIISRGYVDAGHYACVYCGNLLDADAIHVGVQGCMVECAACIEKRVGMSVAEAIRRTNDYNARIARGELNCDICGCPGARPVPGEGQNLCETHNWRRGLNRWS